MTELNVVVMGILDRADHTLKYAQFFAEVGKCVKWYKLKNKSYALRSQKYIMGQTFIAAITFIINVRKPEIVFKRFICENQSPL